MGSPLGVFEPKEHQLVGLKSFIFTGFIFTGLRLQLVTDALQGERQANTYPGLAFLPPTIYCLDFPVAEAKQKPESRRCHWWSPHGSASVGRELGEGRGVDLQTQMKHIWRRRDL